MTCAAWPTGGAGGLTDRHMLSLRRHASAEKIAVAIHVVDAIDAGSARSCAGGLCFVVKPRRSTAVPPAPTFLPQPARRVAAAIQYVMARTGFPDKDICCVAIDAWGRFAKVMPRWCGCPTPVVAEIEFERFRTGNGIDAFLAETGATGEVALEMLSSVVEPPGSLEETPTATERSE